jgi:hypothetical protein
LEPGNLIDLGAVCDLFIADDAVLPIASAPIEIEPAAVIETEKTCVNCCHSYRDSDGYPTCNVDDLMIMDTSTYCSVWEKDYDSIVRDGQTDNARGSGDVEQSADSSSTVYGIEEPRLEESLVDSEGDLELEVEE